MSRDAMSARTRWTIAAVGAVAMLAAVAPLVLLPKLGAFSDSPRVLPPALKLARPGPANPLLRELTTMRDLAPLFLPTERNATVSRIAPRAAGRTALDTETTKLSLGDAEVRFDQELPPAPALNGKPVTNAAPLDALPAPVTMPALLGFGRTPVPADPLPLRGGYVEVIAVATGERLFGDPIEWAARPPTDKPWVPLQFLASVNSVGLVGPLILTERSGVEEVDQHFRNYLAQTYRIGQRLPPGIYRVSIGP